MPSPGTELQALRGANARGANAALVGGFPTGWGAKRRADLHRAHWRVGRFGGLVGVLRNPQ